MKKVDERWKICCFCKYIKACDAGRGRIQNIGNNLHAINEIGCFDYEIYKKQSEGNQLGLF